MGLCDQENTEEVRVPAVAQWVKNPTAAAWVATEAQVQSLAWKSGLKGLVLPTLWLGFNPWPQELPYASLKPIKKKKKKKEYRESDGAF